MKHPFYFFLLLVFTSCHISKMAESPCFQKDFSKEISKVIDIPLEIDANQKLPTNVQEVASTGWIDSTWTEAGPIEEPGDPNPYKDVFCKDGNQIILIMRFPPDDGPYERVYTYKGKVIRTEVMDLSAPEGVTRYNIKYIGNDGNIEIGTQTLWPTPQF